MSFQSEYQHVVLVGTATTTTLDPETVPLSLDGATPVEHVAVPEGKALLIGGAQFCGNNSTKFIVQKSVDGGSTWSDVAIYRSGAAGTAIVPPLLPSPIIGGGEDVLVRVRAQSLSAPGEVSATVACGFLNQ